MKNTISLFAFVFTAFLWSCGGLEKEIELELPVYESQIAVECYLKPGERFTLLLTKTAAYFDPFPTDDFDFVEKILEQEAEVTIRHKGITYELRNEIFFHPITKKVYNYYNDQLVPEEFDSDFSLYIKTADGREITATTRLLPVVPIDSVVVEFNQERESIARVLTYVTEDPSMTNYYRRMLHVGSLDSIPVQDFTTNDDFVDNGQLVFGSGYEYEEGDVVINSIAHIDRAYFDFMESLFFAVDANGNPFGQPAAINSNVTGDAIGIFTGWSVDRVAVTVRK